MFGPNSSRDTFDSHRDERFSSLLVGLESVFKRNFNLKDHHVLFVPGSGTLVNEMVINSLRESMLYKTHSGKFSDRLINHAVKYDSEETEQSQKLAFVYYETSESKIITPGAIICNEPILFCDMISAFPFYDPPDCDIWTCVSGKQLGGLPGLGIIVMKENIYDLLKHPVDSYLSVGHWLNYKMVKKQTPYTPAISLYQSLYESLIGFSVTKLRATIQERREELEERIPNHMVIGEGPVLTISKGYLPRDLAEKYQLYDTPSGWQLFLWTGSDMDYHSFYRELEAFVP